MNTNTQPRPSALALSGSDNYIARVINDGDASSSSTSAPTTGRLRPGRSQALFSGIGGAPKVRNRVLAILAMGLLFLGAFVSLTLQSQTSAQANWFTDAMKNTFCADSAWFHEPQSNTLSRMLKGVVDTGGADANFQSVPLTAEEVLSTGTGTWTVYGGEDKAMIEASEEITGADRAGVKGASEDVRVEYWEASCIPVMDIVSTSVANGFMQINKIFTSLSGFLLQQAYEPTWVDSLMDTASEVITGTDANGNSTGKGLKDALYLEFLNLVIFISAIWLFWRGVAQRKTTEAVSGGLWMLGAVVASTLLVYNPTLLPSVTSDITNEFSQATLVGTASFTADSDNLCALPGEPTQETITRGVTCNLWNATVFQPWVMGQYGVSYAELDGMAPTAVAIGSEHSVNNLAVYQARAQGITPDDRASASARDAKAVMWNNVVDTVASPEASPEAQKLVDEWAGQNSVARIGVATAASVASIMMLIVVAVLAGGMLIASVALVILLFVMPLFALMAIHPGFGRRAAMRWAELWVNALLKKILLALLLAIVLTFYQALLPNVSDNWGVTVLAVIMVTVAMLIYRKELIGIFTKSVSFGGDGWSTAPAEKAGRTMGGLVTGGVVGGAIGGGAGARVATGILKSGEGSRATRVAAAGRAVMGGAGAGAMRMGTRTALSAAHGGGMLGGAILTQGKMGAGAGQSAAQKTANKFNEKHGEKPKQNILGGNAQKFSPAHQKYVRDWEKNKGNQQWQDRIKRQYKLDEVPNPNEEVFDGYGRQRNTWSEGDLPRPMTPQERGLITPSDDAVETSGEGSEAPVSNTVDVPVAPQIEREQGQPTQAPSEPVNSAPEAPVSAPSKSTPPPRPVSPEKKKTQGSSDIDEGKQQAVVNGRREALPNPKFKNESATAASKKAGTSGGSSQAKRRKGTPAVRPQKPNH